MQQSVHWWMRAGRITNSLVIQIQCKVLVVIYQALPYFGFKSLPIICFKPINPFGVWVPNCDAEALPTPHPHLKFRKGGDNVFQSHLHIWGTVWKLTTGDPYKPLPDSLRKVVKTELCSKAQSVKLLELGCWGRADIFMSLSILWFYEYSVKNWEPL